jgi:hypothetical protein
MKTHVDISYAPKLHPSDEHGAFLRPTTCGHLMLALVILVTARAFMIVHGVELTPFEVTKKREKLTTLAKLFLIDFVEVP